jgi:CRISPR-associated protein Cmr1
VIADDARDVPTPPRRERRYVGGPELKSIHVRLRTTTPILGGAPETRQVDSVDFIRAPSIRGHLRFWWRALHGHAFATPQELAARERALWGGVGQTLGTRSQVELHVEVEQDTHSVDSTNVRQQDDKGTYALWPARETKKQKQDAAPRVNPGLCFLLHLRVPAAHATEVENAVRAWILWGGYGSRTRRGVGSLSVVDEASYWLPLSPSLGDLRGLFGGVSLLGSRSREVAPQFPSLNGARLLHGGAELQALPAWLRALNWLRDFRQKEGSDISRKGGSSRFAREKGSERPGRSFWPEADKVRLLLPKTDGSDWAHAPRVAYRVSPSAAWPRAGFGLPLALRFQRSSRRSGNEQGERYAAGEPEDVELRWFDGKDIRERFASPLIVKAMPLAKGTFVPIVLWLRRSWPDKGVVVLTRKREGKKTRERISGSEAPFDRLLAPGDSPLYAPLQATSLAEAFLCWVKAQGATES